MKFKGNNPLKETVHPDPQQKEEGYPRAVPSKRDDSSIESITATENKDRDPLEEDLAETEKDYSGRSDDEVEGARPSDPPDHDPLPFHTLRKPKQPPRNNI